MKPWPTKKISECIDKLPKKSGVPRNGYQKEGHFPVIDQGQDFIGGYTSDEFLVYKNCLPVIVFGDHTRAVKFINFPFAVGADGTKVLKPKDFLDAKYFYLALRSLDIESRGYARHFRILKDKEIPLPSLSEQKKIVVKLERVLAKISEAKKLRASARENTNNLLSAELHKIFEEGKKKGWEEKELGDSAKFIDYRGKTPAKTTSGMRLITAKNVKLGYISLTPHEYVNPNIYNSWMVRGIPKKGDILFTTEAPLGNVTELDTDERVVFAQRVIILQPFKDLHPRFLLYILMGGYVRENILSQATGATAQGIKAAKLKKIKIPLPPLAEQNRIVKHLDSLSQKLQKLQEYQKSTQSDLLTFEQAILYKALSPSPAP